jgi:hypothetical protein
MSSPTAPNNPDGRGRRHCGCYIWAVSIRSATEVEGNFDVDDMTKLADRAGPGSSVIRRYRRLPHVVM